MNTRLSHKTSAIVLRCRDYGESDRIVVFYALEFGKLSGIAKGARKSRKRFANVLEPFSCTQLLFSRRGRDSLAFIENCDIINHHGEIRNDLDKTLVASYFVDLIEQFTIDGKKNDDLYLLLREFLFLIEGGNTAEGLLRFFEIRMLKLLGYQPVLDRCITCKQPVLNGDKYMFHPKDGGIKCGACHRGESDAIAISPGSIKTLLLGRDIETDRINRLVLSYQSAHETRNMLAMFIRHLLGKDLKSLQVLHQVRRLGA